MKPIILDRLENSDEDLKELSLAVQDRFIEVMNLHARARGFILTPTDALTSDLLRWRTMVSRHRKGDFRHRNSEKIALRNVAQWTLDLNSDLKGQPRKVLEWKD